MISTSKDAVRVILLVVRVLAWISSIIVLAITAWAVVKVDGYRVVYPLVIAVLSTAFYIPAMFVSLMKRNRGYMLPMDIVFSYLWLAAFIFLAQHVGIPNCRWFRFGVSTACVRRHSAEAFSFLAFFWTLCSMCLEIVNVYFAGKETVAVPDPHSEKRAHSEASAAPINQPENGAQSTV